MSDVGWVVAGLAALGVVIAIAKAVGSKGAGEVDVLQLFRQKDARVPELVSECVRAARALRIVDEKSSPLLHDPVYDARTDLFDPPCKDKDFGFGFGNCWLKPDTLPEAFASYAEDEASFQLKLSRPRHACMIAADDHIDLLRCPDSLSRPGVSVVRLVRVAEDRWFSFFFTCGTTKSGLGLAGGNLKIVLAPDADDALDPPILAVDVAQDPTLWTRREERLRSRWKLSGTWREAARLCAHRAD